MWDAKKSVVLSSICTKIVMVLVVLFAIGAPYIVGKYIFYAGKVATIKGPLLFTIYACCIPAMVLLLCLNQMLTNIKGDQVFIEQNVTIFRLMSWCSFAVAFIFLVSGFYYILFAFASIAAGFFGLILRVIKNIFAEAVQIKNENDFTI